MVTCIHDPRRSRLVDDKNVTTDANSQTRGDDGFGSTGVHVVDTSDAMKLKYQLARKRGKPRWYKEKNELSLPYTVPTDWKQFCEWDDFAEFDVEKLDEVADVFMTAMGFKVAHTERTDEGVDGNTDVWVTTEPIGENDGVAVRMVINPTVDELKVFEIEEKKE